MFLDLNDFPDDDPREGDFEDLVTLDFVSKRSKHPFDFEWIAGRDIYVVLEPIE
jgi:hypothetical protein